MKISEGRIIRAKKQNHIPENTLTCDKKSPMLGYLFTRQFYEAADRRQIHLAGPCNLAL